MRLATALRTVTVLAALLGTRAIGARAQQRVAEIQISPPYLRMVQDAQTQVVATAYDPDGLPINIRFRWMSSNVNVAVVSENGMVRAVAPGATLITAVVQDSLAPRGRRRYGQITVRVQAPGAAMGGTPSTPPMGGVTVVIPNAMPRMPTVMTIDPRMTDSMIKAGINCDEPMINASNPMRACYDEHAQPRFGRGALTLPSCGSYSGGVMLMLRVDTTGAVSDVRPYVSSPCPLATDSLVASARTLTFQPATRGGQPVVSWFRLLVRTPPQPGDMPPPMRPEPAKP